MWGRFWQWYERNYTANVVIATIIFVLQLVHLYWLFTHAVLLRLYGVSLFPTSSFVQSLIVFIDYFEIPVLFGVSLIYINELRKGFSWKPLILLLLLNSQWIHIFWITDEFVVDVFAGSSFVVWPIWLAWVAIGIDYLELPVMYDAAKRAIRALAVR